MLQSRRKNSKILPRSQATPAHQWPMDPTANGKESPCQYNGTGVTRIPHSGSGGWNNTVRHKIRTYPQFRGEDPTIPHNHVMHEAPGHGPMPLNNGPISSTLHEQQTSWPQLAFHPENQLEKPRHRCLTAVKIVNEKNAGYRTAMQEVNKPRNRCTSESEHRKRRHATTGNVKNPEAPATR